MPKKPVQIIPHDNAMELGKRTYLPFIIKAPCPECNKMCKVDLTKFPLEYPVIGEPNMVYFLCDKCDEDFQINVVLNITLTLEA